MPQEQSIILGALQPVDLLYPTPTSLHPHLHPGVIQKTKQVHGRGTCVPVGVMLSDILHFPTVLPAPLPLQVSELSFTRPFPSFSEFFPDCGTCFFGFLPVVSWHLLGSQSCLLPSRPPQLMLSSVGSLQPQLLLHLQFSSRTVHKVPTSSYGKYTNSASAPHSWAGPYTVGCAWCLRLGPPRHDSWVMRSWSPAKSWRTTVEFLHVTSPCMPPTRPPSLSDYQVRALSLSATWGYTELVLHPYLGCITLGFLFGIEWGCRHPPTAWHRFSHSVPCSLIDSLSPPSYGVHRFSHSVPCSLIDSLSPPSYGVAPIFT
ncbi:hypothetical protein NQ318_008357 [Aromia moschata]|uniref:Cytochrome c biogenesis B n=1 Tax=Aromia moschata TaxID=1265417 RepID=A0AAV8YIU8_9CUCU|nr:hypothetical protein NQ318_008357 [Aromia moschata]